MKETKRKRRSTLRSSFSSLEGDNPLFSMAKSAIGDDFDARHGAPKDYEVALVNGLPVASCPKCGSSDVKRDGFRQDGVRVYRCKACRKRFNPLTGTLFDSHKIPISDWIGFLVDIFRCVSCRTAALGNENADSTGHYWLSKVFLALDGYQDGIELHGDVGVDECFVPVRPKDLSLDAKGRKLKGLSRNQICIYCATDGKGAVLKSFGHGKPSKKGIRATILPHIGTASRFHDDGEKSHSAIEEELGLERTVHLSKDTKGLADKENPMEDINGVHRLFKRLIRAHGAFDREDIGHWCDLGAFLYNHHGDVAGMVTDLLERAISGRRIARYREILAKKKK
jgi:ribosomal protein L37AE/L43A